MLHPISQAKRVPCVLREYASAVVIKMEIPTVVVLKGRINMQKNTLDGLRVAILVTDDFEQVELTEPKNALEQARATAYIISPKSGQVQGMNHDVKADTFPVDMTLGQA